MESPHFQNVDPYQAVGLSGNPFAYHNDPETPPETWIDRGLTPPEPGKKLFVQVLGDRGVGKTSHLLHWRSLHPGPYSYYPIEYRQRWQFPKIAAISYWDEADRIPLPLLITGLAIASQYRATIVVGTHRNLGKFARLLGFRVQTLTPPRLDFDTLMTWAQQRIESRTLPEKGTCNLTLNPVTIADIVEHSQGCWREAGDLLHIWAAQTVLALQKNTQYPQQRTLDTTLL